MITIEEINIVCNIDKIISICSVIIACLSLIIAIISVWVAKNIGNTQIKQNEEMEKLQRKIDERDEKRHMDEINSKSNAFLTKYIDNIKLLPLCAIASMYKTSSNFIKYSNEMYNEFSVLPIEMQNNILKQGKVNFEIKEYKNFYILCTDKLKKCFEEISKNDVEFFSENEKIFKESMDNFVKNQKVLNVFTETVSLESCTSKTVYERDYNFRNLCFSQILGHIKDKYEELNLNDLFMMDMENKSSKNRSWFCYCVCLRIGFFIIVYKSLNNDIDEILKSEIILDEDCETIEDLFLWCLFEIYTKLVLE